MKSVVAKGFKAMSALPPTVNDNNGDEQKNHDQSTEKRVFAHALLWWPDIWSSSFDQILDTHTTYAKDQKNKKA